MPGFYAPSEEELAKGQGNTFPRLEEDEYVIKITGFVEKPNMPNNFAKEGEPATRDMLQVKYDVLTFADGEPLVAYQYPDENATEEEEVTLDKLPGAVLIDPKRVGMVPFPSKARKLFAAALGQPVGQPIRIDDFNQLVGSLLIAAIKNEKGYNNAKDFRSIKRARGRATTPKGPQSADTAVRRAAEVFDEDSPTNTSPNPLNSEDDLDF